MQKTNQKTEKPRGQGEGSADSRVRAFALASDGRAGVRGSRCGIEPPLPGPPGRNKVNGIKVSRRPFTHELHMDQSRHQPPDDVDHPDGRGSCCRPAANAFGAIHSPAHLAIGGNDVPRNPRSRGRRLRLGRSSAIAPHPHLRRHRLLSFAQTTPAAPKHPGGVCPHPPSIAFEKAGAGAAHVRVPAGSEPDLAGRGRGGISRQDPRLEAAASLPEAIRAAWLSHLPVRAGGFHLPRAAWAAFG